MTEAADTASNIPAILLLWFWWTILSALDLAMRTPPAEGNDQQDRPSPPVDVATSGDDRRFADILRLDPGFSVSAFLEGALRAYEAIVTAYAAADFKTLAPLVSPEVLAAFTKACAERAERGEQLEYTFVCIDAVEVETVEVTAEAMKVTLLFRAQVIDTTRSAAGADPDGASHILEVADRWTFQRAVPVSGRAWTVVATGE